MINKDLILKFCNSIGLDTVGFTRCRKLNELIPVFESRAQLNLQNEFEEQDIEKKVNPFLLMPEGKTIISIAFPYLFPESSKVLKGFSKYTAGEDYHKTVRGYLNKICTFINSLGGKAIPLVDNNPLPERYIAYLSGIGFVGKNNMLITEKYGSYVFLGEIITDLEIQINEELAPERLLEGLSYYEKCGDCTRCFEGCPTKSINEMRKNSNICLSYITQKKHIEDILFKKLEGRIFGCDTCQNMCPYNDQIEYSSLEEFRPYDFMIKGDTDELININNALFREKYSKTSCGWRGKNVLQRNALINNPDRLKNLDPKDIPSDYVKDYYNRLLKFFNL
jgi:epoxyqueuosine reductase